MKKLSALLVITTVIGLASCKKENKVKPAAPLPQPTLKAPEKVNTLPYDYQKAMMVKHMANGGN